MRRPLTVGHRGASALAPENTLAAFELAIEHGLDMAELDVHLSQDDQLMVVHDPDLTRAVGRPDRVDSLTADELVAFGIPRLVDVFAVARGRLGLYVELKGLGTGAALGQLVRSGAAAGVELISGSFLPELVAELRAVDGSIPRSVLFARTTIEDMIEMCRAVGAVYAHPCFRPVDRATVDALHDAELLVMTPHSNDPREVRDFASIGVDVIASDDPRVLAALKS